MKIINELAYCSIKSNKKDTFAIKISIFLAVVLLGTVIFIMSSIRKEQYNYISSALGDYHVSISGINEYMYKYLKENKDIKEIAVSRLIETDLGAVIIENDLKNRETERLDILSGRSPSSSGEIIVPTKFLIKNKLKLGFELNVANKNYKIVGEYDEHERSYSFEEASLLAYLTDEAKLNLFEENAGIEVKLWFNNPRDTYILTKQILKDFNIDYKLAENTGRLYFNKDILEYKMIYPFGIIPPKRVIENIIETYSGCLLLSFLFAVMIYGAFNVWNSRDMRELSLLKSVGMTERQIRKMIRLKAFNLSVIPIILGVIIAYFTSNLLLYLMWLNNKLSYINISKIIGTSMRAMDFHFVSISLFSILSIIILALFTVYLSAFLPSRKSAKLKIIEGLNGISEKKVKSGKSKIVGKIENSLAKDYFKSYKSTYIIIILTMIISAMVLSVVLVSQSYKVLITKYDKYNSSYNFISNIYSASELDEKFIEEIRAVEGIDEIQIYENKDFKFFLKDNPNFISDELSEEFQAGKKSEEDLYARIYGLSDEVFQKILKENHLDSTVSYILLNKMTDNDRTPYAFRNYIPITNEIDKEIYLRYEAKGKTMAVQIDGYIDEMPYDLDSYGKSGIYIFTKIFELDDFIEENGNDEADPTYYYNIKIKSKNNLMTVTDKFKQIISIYIPKSDYSISTDILKSAMNKEENRNILLLNSGIQIILLIIALSNAYNSFHGNLRSRKREVQLLSTIGMTDKQIKKMIFSETEILFRNTIISYIFVFSLAIAARAYRSNFDFVFAVKNLIINLNYIPIIIIFFVMIIGVIFAINSGIKNILSENLNDTIREI